MLAFATFDKTDIYIVAVTIVFCILIGSIFYLLRHTALSLDTLQGLAAIANSKGGLVVLMAFMWFFTLTGTTAFCIWVLVKGIDPQNGVLVTLLGMLVSGAFGTVNGALFRSMSGEEPKKQGNGNGTNSPPQSPPSAPSSSPGT
jgi:hypothetical protein